jgi:NADH-quinone oxidoreductase subunit N
LGAANHAGNAMNLTEQLFQILHDLGHLGAELSLLVGACLVLILGLFRVPIIAIKLLVALVLVFVLLQVHTTGEVLFGEMVRTSQLSWTFTKIMLLTSIGLLIFTTNLNQRSSYYFILLITLLGSIWMMHAQHFLLIYLAIEMVSYGAYLMTNFSFQKNSHEAGIKYLLFGGVCSAIMLFGITMVYGVNGSLFLESISLDSGYAKMGALLFLVGVLFKVSAVPFHTWVPNVYQAAPADATAFFSVVPKLAALILLKNTLIAWEWMTLPIVVFGLLSIFMGTLGALKQTNIRRLVSYGAIAHTGFLLPFVIWDLPVEGFILYAAIYAIMNVCIFYAVEQFERNGHMTLEDMRGAGKQSIVLGVGITVVLLALIGLPPTVGFTSKWILFSGIWGQFQIVGDYWMLTYLIVSVLATAVAVYYYLRPSYNLFILDESKVNGKFSITSSVVLVIFTLLMIGLFIYPESLNWL